MTRVLSTLKALGYKIELKGENIRLTYTGKGKPDKDKVLPLIEELKAHKEEIVRELKEDPFRILFKEVVDEINKEYLPGTIDHISVHYPKFYQEISQVEDSLSKLWIEGVDINKFRGILKLWYSLHLKGVELYKRRAN